MLFKTVLLEYYTHGLSYSTEEAERYHRQLDQDSDKNGPVDSKDCSQRDRDLRRGGFSVESVLSKTAGDSNSQGEGLRGLLYLRPHRRCISSRQGIVSA